MNDALDGRVALRVVISLVSVLSGVRPDVTKQTIEVLRHQLETAEDEGERLELTIAVDMLDRITAGPD